MTSSNPNSNPNANANTGPTFRPFAVNRKGSVKFIPANSVGLSKPSISQATQTGGDQIQVTWGDGGGNTYRLQVSTNGGTSFSDVTTTSGLSFTHTGLSFPGSYTYRVRAELGGDVSDYSDNVTETMVDVPSAPGSLAVTGATTSSISLSWNDTANESSYLVEVSPDGLGSWTTAGTTGQNVTTFTHSGLAESVQRYYRVYAVNKAGSGLASSSDNSWTVPATPTGLTATATSSTQINLSWTDVSTGNTSYKVERSTDNTNWTEIATGLSASATTYSATSLSGSTLYYFRVRAANAARNSAYSGTASATTTASTTVPSAPSGFTTTSSFADSVSLSWTDNSSGTGQETGFDIEVSTNAGSTYSSVTTTAANAVSYSHTGRLESTAYLYRIRATNSAGSSSWVVASSVTTPAAVQSFTATAASSTQINLSWTDKSGVETGFRIERSTDNTNWSLVTTTAANATSFSNTSLNASTLYYYRIRSNSYNGTNDSAWYTANATTTSGALSPSWSLDFSSGTPSGYTLTRASSGTYVDSSGYIASQASGTSGNSAARLTHNSSGTRLGLLVEESRTNELKDSNDFSTGNWTRGSGLVVTSAYATGPDNTTSASRLQLPNTVAIKQNASGNNRRYSFWLKSNTGTNQQCGFWNGTTTVVIQATTAWVRHEIQSTGSQFDFYGWGGAGTTADVLLYGAQAENATTTTSYIATTTAAVTRSADLAHVLDSSITSWGDPGALVIHFYPPGQAGTLLSTDDASTAQVGIEASSTTAARAFWSSGSTSTGTIGTGVQKAVHYWNGSVSKFVLNGGSVQSGTNNLTIANTDFVTLGAEATDSSNVPGTFSQYANCIIRKVEFYSGTLTDANLQTITEPPTYNVEYLVIAGGGGGGSYGGGGAGGYKTATGFSLTLGTSYTVTVGAGGAGNLQPGDNGNDSVFSTITATKGGGGGGYSNPGKNGGSGGGGGTGDATGSPAGTGTSGEGSNGGAGVTGGNVGFAGGGGGGSGGTGTAASGGSGGTNALAGSGGAGTSSSISGSAVVRAGGGGGGSTVTGNGGAGGSGGGGTGGTLSAGGNTAGSTNTGSGGGGRGTGGSAGSNGGSGVVILRMATANYSGTTTGSPTVTTSGSDTILTFNASGSYTA